MWTTAAESAAATSGLTLLIPLALPPAERPNDLPCVIRTNTGIRKEKEREKKDLFVHCTLENADDDVVADVTGGARDFFSFVGGACPPLAAEAAPAPERGGASI